MVEDPEKGLIRLIHLIHLRKAIEEQDAEFDPLTRRIGRIGQVESPKIFYF